MERDLQGIVDASRLAGPRKWTVSDPETGWCVELEVPVAGFVDGALAAYALLRSRIIELEATVHALQQRVESLEDWYDE
jgi:hypothetical protein